MLIVTNRTNPLLSLWAIYQHIKSDDKLIVNLSRDLLIDNLAVSFLIGKSIDNYRRIKFIGKLIIKKFLSLKSVGNNILSAKKFRWYFAFFL